uniref:Uncharacterized protein n=1 Tax=Ananas comosus var. bracteatus TaxID=296719 RepID=A0A6V7NP43_ANACO|nr:unnamed protein product [Ananas comosus var. bracteatus]
MMWEMIREMMWEMIWELNYIRADFVRYERGDKSGAYTRADDVGGDEKDEGVDELDGFSTENFKKNFFSSNKDDSTEDELVYDKDNTIMDYSVKYPDINSFRSALL